MNKYYISALDEQFKFECKVINLSYEYPGYIGEEKWAIITGLTEEELNERYAEKIAIYLVMLSEKSTNFSAAPLIRRLNGN